MKIRHLLAALTAMAAGPAVASANLDVSGRWLTGERTAQIEVKDCGDGSPCGTVVWVKPNPKGVLDAKNPDPSLRTRPLVGVRLLYAFHRGETAWDGGRIYDARSGRTYQARISRSPDGTLSVTGCLGPFCQSQTWTPVK